MTAKKDKLKLLKFGARVNTRKYPKAVVAFNLTTGEVGILPEVHDHTDIVKRHEVRKGWRL